jgi:hypothetical protein
MTHSLIGCLIVTAAVMTALSCRAPEGPAQTTSQPSFSRTPEGTPDLTGIWQAVNTAAWDIQDHVAQQGVPAGQGVVEGNEIPYQPWALAKKQENFKNRLTADPVEALCFLPGVPRVTYMPYPFQIVQSVKHVAMLYEYAETNRTIYTDGSPHLPGAIDSFWMGDSRGRWEGDTLVVDTIHLSNQTWFDRAGNFHSEALHVVERYTPTGPDHINYEVTLEDQKVFTRSWKMSMPLYRRKEPHARILEYPCFSFLQEELQPRK